MVLYLMIKCHIVYLLLRIKSPIAYSASNFSIHLLLNHLGTTTDHNEDEDKAGDQTTLATTFITITFMRIHWLMQ